LAHSPQQELLPHSKSALANEKHYIGGPNILKHCVAGSLILFYVSSRNKGDGAVVAMARIRQAYLRPGGIQTQDLDPSVLNRESLAEVGASKSKTVVVFDNLLLFAKQVPILKLRQIGCGKSNQLMTTRPVSDSQLVDILAEAWPNE
jgi:hypothetical protein